MNAVLLFDTAPTATSSGRDDYTGWLLDPLSNLTVIEQDPLGQRVAITFLALLLSMGTPACEPGGSDAAAAGSDVAGSTAAPWNICDECLDTLCIAPQAACDAACMAVEACIEMLCVHLRAIGSAEEGDCQRSCQDANAGGKALHLAVAGCAVSGSCVPPCVPYPQDYGACRVFMTTGDCAAALAACEASPDCGTYRDCVASCSTLGECLACDSTSERIAGRALLETYERCIAAECITESWLPPFPP